MKRYVAFSALSTLLEFSVYVYFLIGNPWYVWVLAFVALWIANIIGTYIL